MGGTPQAGGGRRQPVSQAAVGGRRRQPTIEAAAGGQGGESISRPSAGDQGREPTTEAAAGGQGGESISRPSAGGQGREPTTETAAGGERRQPTTHAAAGGRRRQPLVEAATGGQGREPTTQPAVGGQRRQPIIEAAIEMTASHGWAAVTMARLAEQVGVSRQTVYNEIGSRNALADAMLAHELARFLTAIRDAFDRHTGDLVEAIHDAVRDVLELARDNLLVRAIASATQGADTELVPLLTTQAESLLTEVKAMLAERVAAYRPRLTTEQVDVLIDLITRAVLSHVVQPAGSPAGTADGIAWLASRVLEEPARKPLRYG